MGQRAWYCRHRISICTNRGIYRGYFSYYRCNNSNVINGYFISILFRISGLRTFSYNFISKYGDSNCSTRELRCLQRYARPSFFIFRNSKLLRCVLAEKESTGMERPDKTNYKIGDLFISNLRWLFHIRNDNSKTGFCHYIFQRRSFWDIIYSHRTMRLTAPTTHVWDDLVSCYFGDFFWFYRIFL